jgi:hypothetical protein
VDAGVEDELMQAGKARRKMSLTSNRSRCFYPNEGKKDEHTLRV